MVSKTELYFKEDYEESRYAFRTHIDRISEKWPHAELSSQTIGEEEDNTIDIIYADALETNDQVVFLTCGEHGIEGYTGAAVIHMFVEEYVDKVDPETTGICLVHAINPWGMRNYRRVTENNVDLNRNYFYHDAPRGINDKYKKEEELFLPQGKIANVEKERMKLYGRLAEAVIHEGYNGVKEAKGMGQFQFARGVYYGGTAAEPNTELIKQWQRKLLSTYSKVTHMDWHTALGPANEVTMAISVKDGRDVEQLASEYQLKNIQPFSSENVKGDSTDYFYTLQAAEFPNTDLVSALFEFGTFGTSKKAELRELQTIVLENHLYWEGAEKEEDRDWILKEFQHMFYPQKEEWRGSVVKEARLAIESVLTKEGIL